VIWITTITSGYLFVIKPQPSLCWCRG